MHAKSCFIQMLKLKSCFNTKMLDVKFCFDIKVFCLKGCFDTKIFEQSLASKSNFLWKHCVLKKKKTVIETFWCWSKTLLQTFWICNKTVFRTFIFWSKLFVQTFSNIYVLKRPLVKVFGLNQDFSANLVWSKTLFKQFTDLPRY